MQRKLDALVDMESQFVEGGALGSADLVAGGEEQRQKRRREVREAFEARDRKTAETYAAELEQWYGKRATPIEYAEAFEICEYGHQPTPEELRTLFPFFPEAKAP